MSQLKGSWTTATENPSSYSSTFLMFERETMVEVRDVPTFVPMMIGIPSLKFIAPDAAIATTKDVVTEDDWIIAVEKTPIIRPRIGLCKLASVRRLPERSWERSLKESVSRKKEQMQK